MQSFYRRPSATPFSSSATSYLRAPARKGVSRRLFLSGTVGGPLIGLSIPAGATTWTQYAPSWFFTAARTIRVVPHLRLDQGGEWRGLRPQWNSGQLPQADTGRLLSPTLQEAAQVRAEEAAVRAIRYARGPRAASGEPPRVLRAAEARGLLRPEAEYRDDCVLGVSIWVRDASDDIAVAPPRGFAVAVIVDGVSYSRQSTSTGVAASELRVTVDTVPRAGADEHILRRLENAVTTALDRGFTEQP